ncbi:MAG TPA: hypothetical protein VMB84_15345 [Stellaceae bacterium]|nr:hypothetical protein [Stellaceae bacterium]
MYAFPEEVLDRLRTLPQALADLVKKHGDLAPDHPDRSAIALMIGQLRIEIAWRAARVVA